MVEELTSASCPLTFTHTHTHTQVQRHTVHVMKHCDNIKMPSVIYEVFALCLVLTWFAETLFLAKPWMIDIVSSHCVTPLASFRHWGLNPGTWLARQMLPLSYTLAPILHRNMEIGKYGS